MRVLAVLSLLVATSGLVSVSAPAAAATQCQGEEATIVGEPGTRVNGTDGPDVIVTNGAKYVYAGAGDDLVCTTAMPDASWVYAGVGDDSVVAGEDGYQRLRVDLGPGSDRFVGGAGRDIVKTFDPVDEANRDDDVSTGRGNDVVQATRPIGPATDDADRIDLGRGRDVLAMGDSGLAPAASVVGGPGRDLISIRSGSEEDVDIQAEKRTIDKNYAPYLYAWESFEQHMVDVAGAHIDFWGSSRADTLVVNSAFALEARMGKGSDVVGMASNLRGNSYGGRGRDEIIVRHSNSSGGSLIDLSVRRPGPCSVIAGRTQ